MKNILFFLTPKSEIAYIYENETLRQALEKMEHRKYSCIPILSLDGRYVATISEGDLLWGMKNLGIQSMKQAEDYPIMSIPRRQNYRTVRANSNMEDLIERAINQIYVPVADDQNSFIGIITRKNIIQYYAKCHMEETEKNKNE